MTQKQKSFLLLFLLSLLHLLVRLDYLYHSQFVIDADEAIVGLMAKHILEGAPLPTFYYGQHYMGSLESILMGFVFSMWGVHALALKVVPLLFSCALLFVIFEIGKKLSNATTGYVAALLYALPPQTLLDWGTKARGGFIEVLFLGGVAILSFIKWRETQRLSFLIITGGVLGVGWWVNNQIIFFMAPLGVFGLYEVCLGGEKIALKIRNACVAVFSFLAGSIPFWVYNIRHNFVSFEMLGAAQDGAMSRHMFGFLEYSLPMLVGGRRFWSDGEVFPYSVVVAWVLAGAVLAAAVIFQRRNYLKNLLVLFFIFTIFIFSVSSFGSLYKAPRYLLPLYVAWFPLASFACVSLFRKKKIFGIFVGFLALSLQLSSSYLGGRAIPGEPLVHARCRVMKNHAEVIERLSELGIKKIRADYWVGYKLAFETKEEVTFVVFGDPSTVRIPSYEKNVDRELTPLLISPCELRAVKNSLIASDILFTEESLGDYVLLYGLKLKDEKNSFTSPVHAGSTHNQDDVSLAFDGNLSTRWGSKTHQVSQMVFNAEFSPGTELKGIKISLGDFKSDYPRSLSIEIMNEKGSWAEVLPVDEYMLLRDMLIKNGEITFYFPRQSVKEVRLVQQGFDPIFDWSIAEIEGVK